jgi:hypothetical protein
MMDLKGCGRKGLWPNFKILSWYFPGGTEGNNDNSLRRDSLRTEIWTGNLPNTKQEC